MENAPAPPLPKGYARGSRVDVRWGRTPPVRGLLAAILFIMQDKNRLEVATEMAYIQTAMTYIKVVSMVDELGKRVSCRKDIIGFLQYKGLDQDVVAYFANAPDREKAIDHVRSKDSRLV